MKRRRFESLLLALVSLCVLGDARGARAKELDQFTDRLRVLEYYAGGYRAISGAPSPARVDGILDDKMNALLDELAVLLAEDKNADDARRLRHVRAVFQHPLLAELITPFEEWAKHEPRLPLYRVRDKGIYGHAVNYDDMRMTWYIELSPILQVNGVLIGLDKLGHFLAQGFQYVEYFRSLDPKLLVPERAARVREFGHEQEVGQLGIATGGVFSMADLAANWSGMLFFLSLFDDVRVEAEQHERFFARDADGVLRRVRDFHWSEWVTSDWDEVLNPAYAEKRALFDKVVENFWRPVGAPGSHSPSICEQYKRDPAAYLGPEQTRTRSRYALPLRVQKVAPYPIDLKRICHAFGPGDAAAQFHR
ncbi:MAG TPA: hypothetical protein VFN67_38410 [Polyangiales bacterium]|nr:hypothetical protein [Polyangiales bacterium]